MILGHLVRSTHLYVICSFHVQLPAIWHLELLWPGGLRTFCNMSDYGFSVVFSLTNQMMPRAPIISLLPICSLFFICQLSFQTPFQRCLSDMKTQLCATRMAWYNWHDWILIQKHEQRVFFFFGNSLNYWLKCNHFLISVISLCFSNMHIPLVCILFSDFKRFMLDIINISINSKI